jgi:hypothetical protein
MAGIEGWEVAIAGVGLVLALTAAAGVSYTLRVVRRIERKYDLRWAQEREPALAMSVFPRKPDAIVTVHNRGGHALLDLHTGVRITGQPVIYGPPPIDIAAR